MRRLVLLLIAALLTSGCPSTASVIKELSKSKRSWCFYSAGGMGIGEVRASGSGIETDGEGQAGANCDSKAHTINKVDGPDRATGPVPGVIVIPAQPRVLIQQAPAFQEVDPNALRAPVKK